MGSGLRLCSVAVTVVSVVVRVGGCTSIEKEPRAVLCGVGLAPEGGAQGGGPFWVDLTGHAPASPVATWHTFGGGAEATVLRVSRSCSHGAVVTVEPADAATLTAEVRAHDGNPVLISVDLRSGVRSVVVQVRQSTGSAAQVVLTSTPPSPASFTPVQGPSGVPT